MKTLLPVLAVTLATSLALAQSPAPTPQPPAVSDAAQAKLEKRFGKLDKNNDAFVDKDEFMKSRSAQKKPGHAEKRFARGDKNGDDKLTKEEWLAAPTRKSKSKTSA